MNWLAALVLLSWPLIAFWLYRTQPLNRAATWTILGGQLLLPVGALAKVAPGIPPLDKTFIPNLAALLGCVVFAGRRVRFFTRIGLAEVFLLMLVGGPFITSMLNRDIVVTGGIPQPALTFYDAVSAAEGQLVAVLAFFVGRQFLREAADTEELLRILVIAELFYSLLALFEIRASPQLHYWLYGYPASSFAQQIRAGGYRPMVFVGHGLVTAFYLMSAVLAATALWRAKMRAGPVGGALAASYLGGVLMLSHSLGALAYAVIVAPLIALTRPRLQVRIAAVVAILAVIYPLARMGDLVPTQTLLEMSASFSADREESLGFRFNQEEQLLARAGERLMFGWGGYSRGHVYDIETGKDLSVLDGVWIIVLSAFGVTGFVALFGLLTLPIFRASAALRFCQTRRDAVLLGATTVILAVNVMDLLPNSPLTPWTWLICGSLLGRAEALRAAAPVRRVAKTAPPNPLPRPPLRAAGGASAPAGGPAARRDTARSPVGHAHKEP